MVHYIFHPLDLIVEASCAILGPDDQPLWEHVLNPLLTPEAVTFLDDCLSTKEMELWRSLGSAWNISSAERLDALRFLLRSNSLVWSSDRVQTKDFKLKGDLFRHAVIGSNCCCKYLAKVRITTDNYLRYFMDFQHFFHQNGIAIRSKLIQKNHKFSGIFG